jgi:hypothetical protein
MNITALIRVLALLLLALASTVFAQTVREQLKDPSFKLYSVIFGITVDAESKVQTFKVAEVIDATSGKPDPVDIPVPQSFIDAAKKKAEAKRYKPSFKDGKPVEFFTYFLYTPKLPETVVSDVDQPLDKQP